MKYVEWGVLMLLRSSNCSSSVCVYLPHSRRRDGLIKMIQWRSNKKSEIKTTINWPDREIIAPYAYYDNNIIHYTSNCDTEILPIVVLSLLCYNSWFRNTYWEILRYFYESEPRPINHCLINLPISDNNDNKVEPSKETNVLNVM